MKAPKLQSTSRYEMFELIDFNRDVAKTKALEASMRKHGFLPQHPLHCANGASTRKLIVKAGHHRLYVATYLGIKVWYVVWDDNVTVYELEKATVPWSMQDYLTSFCKCGVEPYLAVRDYHARTGIPLGHCIALVGGETAGSSNQMARFKAGTYTVSEDASHREAVADIVEHCIKCGVAHARHNLFVQAISRCLRADEFNPKTFKTRVSANPGLVTKCPDVAGTTAVIEAVYNHGAHTAKRLPLTFLVDQVMRQRLEKAKRQIGTTGRRKAKDKNK